MFQTLLTMPTLIGALAFIAITTAMGMAVYYVTYRCHARRRSETAFNEVKDATGNLFRVVGWLFTLLLSITFSNVISDLALTRAAIQNEASAIDDVNQNLQRFNSNESREIQQSLAGYLQAVIEDEWPALAEDRLSELAEKRLSQVEDAILSLATEGPVQETSRSRAIDDVDLISGHRLARLQQAIDQHSQALFVILFGYLVTMVYFGIYPPRIGMIVLLSFYTAFIGVIIYLMLAMSDPFYGSFAVDPAPFEYVLESMKSID